MVLKIIKSTLNSTFFNVIITLGDNMFQKLINKIFEKLDEKAVYIEANATVTRSEVKNELLWYYVKFIGQDGLEHESMLANTFKYEIGETLRIRYLANDKKYELCELVPTEIEKYQNRG